MSFKYKTKIVETETLSSSPQRLCWYALILVTVCLFILNRPYYGIIHDSRLYTIEALKIISGQNYVNDFYFLNSYQGKYSIASLIYAKYIEIFGLPKANLFLLIASQTLWLAGAYLTTGVFFRGFNHFSALALLVSFPSYYGGFAIFSFCERFYTPRLTAEALVIFSLYFITKRNWAMCLLCTILGFLLHPLMSIPGIVVLILIALRNHNKFLWALIPAGLCIIALGTFGSEPFSNIFNSMDGNWLDAAQERSRHIFITMWPAKDLVLTLVMFILGFMAYFQPLNKQKELVRSILVTTILLNATSLIGADLLHNVLIIQLQLWRSSWLLFYIVALFFYNISAEYCAQGPFGLAAVIFMCTAFIDSTSPSYSYIAFFLSISIFTVIRWNFFPVIRWESDKIRNKIFVYVFILFFILIAIKAFESYSVSNRLNANENIWNALSVTHPLLVVMGLFLGKLIFLRSKHCAIILIAMGFVACLCATTWDRRGSTQNLMFAADAQTHRIQRIIPSSSLVFWPGACEFSWFYLRRSNFISALQAAGVIFSKSQAEEYTYKRWLVGLDEASNLCSGFVNMSIGTGNKLFSSAKIDYICKQYNDLDFIIVPDYFLNLKPVASFSPKIVYSDNLRFFPNERPVVNPKLYIYSCDIIRSNNCSSASVN